MWSLWQYHHFWSSLRNNKSTIFPLEIQLFKHFLWRDKVGNSAFWHQENWKKVQRHYFWQLYLDYDGKWRNIFNFICRSGLGLWLDLQNFRYKSWWGRFHFVRINWSKWKSRGSLGFQLEYRTVRWYPWKWSWGEGKVNRWNAWKRWGFWRKSAAN